MRLADHLRTPRTFQGLPYEHHGIYVGKKTVIHYSGFAGGGLSSKSGASICEASLSAFEDGRGSAVVRYQASFPPEEVLLRARSCVGESDYNLVRNNCEHFAVWCKTGRLVSHQVDLALGNPLVPETGVQLAAGIWVDLRAIWTVLARHRRIRKALRAEEVEREARAAQRLAELRLALHARVAVLRGRLEARDHGAEVTARRLRARNAEIVARMRKLEPGHPDALLVARSVNQLLELM